MRAEDPRICSLAGGGGQSGQVGPAWARCGWDLGRFTTDVPLLSARSPVRTGCGRFHWLGPGQAHASLVTFPANHGCHHTLARDLIAQTLSLFVALLTIDERKPLLRRERPLLAQPFDSPAGGGPVAAVVHARRLPPARDCSKGPFLSGKTLGNRRPGVGMAFSACSSTARNSPNSSSNAPYST